MTKLSEAEFLDSYSSKLSTLKTANEDLANALAESEKKYRQTVAVSFALFPLQMSAYRF